MCLHLMPSILSPSTCHAEGIPTNWGIHVIFPGCLPSNINHWLGLFKCGPTVVICDSGGVTLWNNYFTGLRSMSRAGNKQHIGRGGVGRQNGEKAIWMKCKASCSPSLFLPLSEIYGRCTWHGSSSEEALSLLPCLSLFPSLDPIAAAPGLAHLLHLPKKASDKY